MKIPTSTDLLASSESLLNQYPLLIEKISTAANLSHQDVRLLFCEVIKYLFTVAESRERLTPSMPVDLAWHEFILFTKVYQDFCVQTFGRFIHHHPGGSDKENQRQFFVTLEYYQKYFGTPDPEFWGSAASCGACEAK